MTTEPRTRLFPTTSVVNVFVLFGLALACASRAQDQLSLAHFHGSESWPVYSPGEIPLANTEVRDLRTAYDAEFATPDGVLELANTIDLMNVMFNGSPAHWMQWTFTSEAPGDGGAAPSLDLLVMDRASGALKFRMRPSAPGSTWGGPYNLIGVGDESVRRVIASDDGESKTEIIPIDGPVFDFGGLPFVFPFMKLEPGQGFRLHAYQQSGASGVQLLTVKVIGHTEILDTRGKPHDVLEIQTLAPSRATRVSFYVSNRPPYFYGYDYRQVKEGISLFKMTYRGLVSTEIKREG